jgi:hypothetical protein
MAKARTLTLRNKVEVTGADKLKGLGSQMQSTGKKLTTNLTLPIVALGGAMVALAARQEDAERKMTSTFESMGAAVWTTTDALKEQASALQEVTTFGDEEILEMQSVMLTFGNVTGEAFDKASVAALDMSAALGTDLQSSAIQLGKALNDPIKGVSALSRVGVSFTEQQKEMIRTLAESGDLLGAQNIILGEMEKQFGGTAEALSKTTSGQIKQAMNTLGDAGEQFGAVIAPAVADIAQAIKGFAEFLQDLSPEWRKGIVLAGAFVAALGPLLFITGSLIKAVVGLGKAYKFFFVAASPGKLSRVAGGMRLIGLAAHAMLGPIGLVTGAIALLVAGVQTNFLGMGDAAERANKRIAGFLSDFGDNIRGFFGSVEEEAPKAARGFTSLTEAQQEAVIESGREWERMQAITGAGAEATAAVLASNAGRMTEAATETLLTPMVVAMLGGKERAEEIAGETPGAVAQALLDAQFKVEDAAAQLARVAEEALHPLIERSQIIAFLSSQELSDGLNSGIPAVRAAALELKQAAETRLSELSGSAWAFGNSAGTSFAAGMNAAYGYVRDAAGNLAAAARNQIGIQSEPRDRSSPLYGITKWGKNLGLQFADDILSTVNAVAASTRALAAAAVPGASLGAMTPALAGVPAGSRGGGDVHYHGPTINLTIEGERASSDEDSIRRLLQRMASSWS